MAESRREDAQRDGPRGPADLRPDADDPDIDAARSLARTGGAESTDHVDAIRPEKTGREEPEPDEEPGP